MAERQEAWERRFFEGDREALRWLVETYQAPMVRMGWRFYGQAAEAQDFAQDVFVHAFERRSRYDPARPLQPWLFTVAANLGRERMRKFREVPSGDDLPDAGVAPEVERGLEQEEERNLVARLLRKLPPKHREVLAMRFESGLSLADTAQALRVPLGTVKSRLSRALEEFHRAYLGAERRAIHE